MGNIIDIPQPRTLFRCQNPKFVFTPSFNQIGYGTATIVDNLDLYFGNTNHRLQHTGELLFRLKSANPTAFGIGEINMAVGFIPEGFACTTTASNLSSRRWYGFSGVSRFSGVDHRIRWRNGGETSTAKLQGISDANYTGSGVIFRCIVGNRFVSWYYGASGSVLQPLGGPPDFEFSFLPAQRPYIETPTGYINVGSANGGYLPPIASRFRWNGGIARVFETLVPMFALKTDLSCEILSVTAGEPANVNVPVQP